MQIGHNFIGKIRQLDDVLVCFFFRSFDWSPTHSIAYSNYEHSIEKKEPSTEVSILRCVRVYASSQLIVYYESFVKYYVRKMAHAINRYLHLNRSDSTLLGSNAWNAWNTGKCILKMEFDIKNRIIKLAEVLTWSHAGVKCVPHFGKFS